MNGLTQQAHIAFQRRAAVFIEMEPYSIGTGQLIVH